MSARRTISRVQNCSDRGKKANKGAPDRRRPRCPGGHHSRATGSRCSQHRHPSTGAAARLRRRRDCSSGTDSQLPLPGCERRAGSKADLPGGQSPVSTCIRVRIIFSRDEELCGGSRAHGLTARAAFVSPARTKHFNSARPVLVLPLPLEHLDARKRLEGSAGRQSTLRGGFEREDLALLLVDVAAAVRVAGRSRRGE